VSILILQASKQSCLCDFTFDFIWQHRGTRLNPDGAVGPYSYRKLVEAIKAGQTVRIEGDVGSRLASSMGVDLAKLGGSGGPIETTGSVIVDGNVGNRMGISMLRGSVYLSGKAEEPLGNVLEVETDRSGYRKFVSLTEILERSLAPKEPNRFQDGSLVVCDGILRDTLGARNPTDRTVRLLGEAGMSTGILMKAGLIDVHGGAHENTGALMRQGRLIVRGKTGDFTGVEMSGGEIFVLGDAGSYACHKMRGGCIYAREGKPLPPAGSRPLRPAEQTLVSRILEISPLYAMMYRRLGLES
jgi:formylmethanofuran dehydrogenase subunit C